jgi:aspartyl-tRNA(Asn)/glutamyl-tRNA(Gln) amidotransferase subunit C
MATTVKDVEHVAKLARLELTPEEAERYTQDLNNILELVAQLNEADLSGLYLSLSTKEPVVYREDIARREFTREALLANAPHEENGFFRVPKILD